MYLSIVVFPLIGCIFSGLFGRILSPKGSAIISITCVFSSLCLSLLCLFEVGFSRCPTYIKLYPWIDSELFDASWGFLFDSLTSSMCVTVTLISTLVHIYSTSYMSHDPHQSRFMSYLSLFTFSMLMLITADNLLQLVFGWEAVGLCSFLLINFWFTRLSANKAAIKAMVVNRIGDFALALGIFVIYNEFKTVDYSVLFSLVPYYTTKTIYFLQFEFDLITTICVLLFVGAMGKSAQLGLHSWLPDAMEGPTPVSALIHAATMVTAGVFMICRLSPMLEYAPFALDVITVIGALTAIFAATVGMTQFDIKRVIAYSTCSQLGYMFFAAGVSAYPAAMFHLTTHAFFKALLFLGAGSVIHALSDEQDLRKMCGIWKKVPVTYALMWIGSLALAGFPFFAGYYSKDMILEAAYAAQSGVGSMAFWLGCLAAFLTAFYSWRLLIMAFHGAPRASAQVMSHVHESPKVMTLPLLVLAIGAVFAGWLGYELFVGHDMKQFWGASIFILPTHTAMEDAHHVPTWVKLLPIVLASSGVGLAVLFYAYWTSMPARIAAIFRPIYLLFYNKWYFDELYDAIFVRPAVRFGAYLWQRGDRDTIDGFGPEGMSAFIYRLSGMCSRVQTGFVFHYAFAMLIGVVVLVSWYYLRFKGA